MKPKYKRLQYILVSLVLGSIGLWLIIKNFNENIVFFYTPTEIAQKNINNQVIRVGGLVVKDSIIKNGITTQFTITDNENNLIIKFDGALPNLFREGQGIVAKGKKTDNFFIANELLAKHDENYMPKEVAESLKKSGVWKDSK